MKLYQTFTFDCGSCHDTGYLYWGDNEDYSVEPCQCVADKVGV